MRQHEDVRRLSGARGDAIQTVLVLFVAYFGRKTHKPRYLSCSAVFSGIAAMMLSLPYIIYGPLTYDNGVQTASSSSSSSSSLLNTIQSVLNSTHTESSPLNFQMCDGVSANLSNGRCAGGEGGEQVESNTAAYAIFLLAFVILNMSGCGLHTLGIAFIDENVKKEDSGVYIGAVMSMFAVGPIFGFSLAAFSTGMPEDLSNTSLSQNDPDFIGCWWLGGFIIGSLMILASVPLFFIPKHFPAYYRYHKVPPKARRVSQVALSTVAYEMKQFPKSLARLAMNPALAFLLLSKVFSTYLVVGVFVNVPRYIEIHFRQPAFVSNIGSAIGGLVSGGLGNLCGGFIMKKWNMQPIGSARVYSLTVLATIGGLFVMMFLACPQTVVHGEASPTQKWIEVANECNANCGCDRNRLQSVCSPDGELYFSPCHAGCQEHNNGTYSACSCTSGNVTTLTADWCGESCWLYYPYLATVIGISFLGNMARIPATVLMFRLVDEELKAFALGLMSSLFNLLVFVPGPIMFGALYDSTCLLWQSICGSRGACLIYDVDQFRLYMHGICQVFLAASLLLAGVMYYYVVKQFKGKKGTKDDSHVDGQEALPLKSNVDDAS